MLYLLWSVSFAQNYSYGKFIKSNKDEIELAPLESIKKEIPDVNDNQNSKNYTESDLAVDEEEDGETGKGKRWFINPFYSS